MGSINGEKKNNISRHKVKFAEKELSFRPIPRDQTQFYEQKNAFYFTNEEKTFYGSKIVKDIIVYR